MHARLVGLLVLCEHAGRPGEKASRYAGCPGTQGLTFSNMLKAADKFDVLPLLNAAVVATEKTWCQEIGRAHV